jgi:endoglucanase
MRCAGASAPTARSAFRAGAIGLAALWFVVAGCSSSESGDDGDSDAGARFDAGSPSDAAGGPSDAGPSGRDASGARDAGGVDARGGSNADASGTDGGAREAGGGSVSDYNHLYGVSLAGADFGEGNLPGTFNVDYTYPTHEEVDYYMAKGLSIFRIPFRWERLQRTPSGEFDAAELPRLRDIVDYATSKGAWVLLDPHNYARYNGAIIGDTGSPVTAAAFADFWRRLSTTFTHPHVVYGLMNEPRDMRTELWLADANAAITAIRGAGARNLVLVPGNAWTGAHSWDETWYGSSNASVLTGVVDPMNNFAFEVHQYLDDDSSGTHPNCTGAAVGSQRVAAFEDWLRQHHYRGFLGEYGSGRNQTCYDAIGDLLTDLRSKDDLWVGWTYWAGGPWWGGSEMIIEPQNGVDDPRIAILKAHM